MLKIRLSGVLLFNIYLLFISFIISCGASTTKKTEPLVPLVVVEGHPDATSEGQESFNLNPDSPVTNKNLKQIVSNSFSQTIEISPDDENFKEKTTTFLQSDETPPKVDILVVVDNSGSMEEEQANLAPKLSALLEHIKSIDWQINVIATDNACPKQSYLPLNSEMDPEDVEKKFEEAVSLGTGGDHNERGILMAVSNLLGIKAGKCSQAPMPWLREKSKIAIIFVTDENEADVNEDFVANKDLLLAAFKELNRKVNSEAKAYGLLNLGAGSKKCAYESQQSVLYQEAVFATGGFFGNICASDYSTVLGEISQDVSYLTSLRIQLSGEPVYSSMSVSLVDSTSLPASGSTLGGGGGLFLDWLIIGDMLVLAKPLEPGSLITIKYKTSQARFIKLDQKVEENVEFQVFFDNKEVNSGAYRFLSQDNGLFFKDDLPLGVKIVIKITRPSELIEHFDFPKVNGSIECFDEQNQKLNHVYSAYTGKISFEKTLAEGATAYCLYRQ
ncbi:MAG: VWA domain-containing protein [Oligoflexales bacterium]|nr:VWA domain-containing protein [Oligoflexales bacterium]